MKPVIITINKLMKGNPRFCISTKRVYKECYSCPSCKNCKGAIKTKEGNKILRRLRKIQETKKKLNDEFDELTKNFYVIPKNI